MLIRQLKYKKKSNLIILSEGTKKERFMGYKRTGNFSEVNYRPFFLPKRVTLLIIFLKTKLNGFCFPIVTK